tara:strand:+ start:6483 stop:6776 length:294 start_codon:yes stop_codon:yes gene_type:complete
LSNLIDGKPFKSLFSDEDLQKIFGKDNYKTIAIPRKKVVEVEEVEEEVIEPEIQAVQCSRCLKIQNADVSQTIAITCKHCGETDAAYLDDFVDTTFW